MAPAGARRHGWGEGWVEGWVGLDPDPGLGLRSWQRRWVALRQFLVEALPGLTWLLERHVTVAWWDVADGWVLRVEQRHSGPGPHSIASLQRADDDRRAVTYQWVAPEEPAALATAEKVVEDLLRAGRRERLDLTRRGCMLAGVWWELDEYHGSLDGLILARCERASDSTEAVTSWWLGPEVTGEPGYDERALAVRARP